MKAKYNKLIGNTLIFTVGNFGSKLITFFLVPLYTNILSTSEYGIANLINTYATVIVPFVSVVIQDAVLRYGLLKEEKGQVIKAANVVFIFSCIFSLILIQFPSPLNDIIEWRWYLFAIIVTTIADSIWGAYAKVKGKNLSYAISSIAQALVLTLTNVVALVFLRTGVRGYLFANIIANFSYFAILFFSTHSFFDIKDSSLDKGLLKEMLIFSAPLILNNLSWWILTSCDYLMIKKYISVSALGIYVAASKIPNLLAILSAIFSQAWTVSSINEYDTDKDKQFFSNVFRAFSSVMFLGASFLMLVLKPFMKVYVGREFYSGWTCVPYLVLGAVFVSYSTFFGVLFSAEKKNMSCTVTTLVAAFINICANVLLIPRMGIIGAAISTAISYFIIAIYRMIKSRTFFVFPISWLSFWISSFVIITQAILISLNINSICVSFVAISCLLMIMKNDLILLSNQIKDFKKRISNKKETI